MELVGKIIFYNKRFFKVTKADTLGKKISLLGFYLIDMEIPPGSHISHLLLDPSEIEIKD